MDIKLGNPAQSLYKASPSKAKNTGKTYLATEGLIAEKDLLQNSKASSSYDVSLSTKAQDIRAAYEKALEIAMTTPDIREDKVEAWKMRLKNNDYKVSAENIADGILKEAMKDHLAQMG